MPKKATTKEEVEALKRVVENISRSLNTFIQNQNGTNAAIDIILGHYMGKISVDDYNELKRQLDALKQPAVSNAPKLPPVKEAEKK